MKSNIFSFKTFRSFEDLQNWLKEVETYSTYPNIVKLLVGNKIDLTDSRKIQTQQGKKFAKDHGMLFLECSAKSSIGVEQAFEELVEKVRYQALNL